VTESRARASRVLMWPIRERPWLELVASGRAGAMSAREVVRGLLRGVHAAGGACDCWCCASAYQT